MTSYKILIAIPYSKYIEAGTFKSVYDLEVPANCVLEFHYFSGYAVDQIRNVICDRAIQNNFDYILFVDSDIIIPKMGLTSLLGHNKDIICGLYRRKIDNLEVEIFDYELQRISSIPEDLQEIGGCGFGCVLIKTEVLANIGYPQFQYHQTLSHKDSISEDLDLCAKARILGYNIFCDPTIKCGHIGNTVYNL